MRLWPKSAKHWGRVFMRRGSRSVSRRMFGSRHKARLAKKKGVPYF